MANPKQRRCAHCGKRFRTTSPARQYCSDACKKEAARARRRARSMEPEERPDGLSDLDAARASLATVLECIPESKRSMAEGVADDLAFLAASCATLRVQLSQEGFTDRYSNGGGQGGTKQSPAWLTYNQALRQKRDYVKLLADLADGDSAATDALRAWQAAN